MQALDVWPSDGLVGLALIGLGVARFRNRRPANEV
jgi:hypothetical protein